jgi:hypothetical protein
VHPAWSQFWLYYGVFTGDQARKFTVQPCSIYTGEEMLSLDGGHLRNEVWVQAMNIVTAPDSVLDEAHRQPDLDSQNGE